MRHITKPCNCILWRIQNLFANTLPLPDEAHYMSCSFGYALQQQVTLKKHKLINLGIQSSDVLEDKKSIT